MPLYDYLCDGGHRTEARRGRECQAVLCPVCGQTAERVPFYESQFIIGETVAKGITKATRAGNIKDKHGRTRLSLFQEACADIDYAHGRAEEQAGRELPSPPLYKTAVRRAKGIIDARSKRQAIS